MPTAADRSSSPPPLGATAGGLGPELAPTARRVLEAAKRIVSERGLQALTLDAVARESGEYRSAIRYHFGDKAGLVSAVMDSTALTPTATPLFAAVTRVEPGPPRIAAHLAALMAVSSDREQFRLFWALLPHMLNEPGLREKLSGLYEGYVRINREALGAGAQTAPDERRLRGLARLLTAVCDGLGLVACLQDDEGPGPPSGESSAEADVAAAYEVLGEMLEVYVPRFAPPSAEAPLPRVREGS